MLDENLINEVLDYTRVSVTRKIEELIHVKKKVLGAYENLYGMLSDYPFRKGKALRPALCISTARAVGGMAQTALLSAAALEMYHNAFLIHDDVEDGSESRRGKDTLHQLLGVPRAVNIGDATNVLALSFLLENLKIIGVTKSLHVMHEIEHMARQSVEGQSMELDWVADQSFDLTDADYFTMCTKKTCWYTFIAPCRIGYIVGQPAWNERDVIVGLERLTEFGMTLGIAFQIQDDLLNLTGSVRKYGKEICGDIYEGKRTIMLNHLLAHAGSNREQVISIMQKPRRRKTAEEVKFVLKEMYRCGSIKYGKSLSKKYSSLALKQLEAMDFLQSESPVLPEEAWQYGTADRRFITELVNYVVMRKL